MFRHLRTALPLLATLAWPAADAAEVRDRAGMFSAEAVKKAEAELNRIEKQTGVPIAVETIEAMPPSSHQAGVDAKEAINRVALSNARERSEGGVYMLISKKDHVFSKLLVSDHFDRVFPEAKRAQARDALLAAFKKGDFDGGLASLASEIDAALPDGPVAEKARRLAPRGEIPGGRVVVQRQGRQEGQFGFGSLLMLGLGVLAVLFIVRLISGAFGGGGQGGYPQGMPRPGPGMGMGGPGFGGGGGYGGPGYGGRGGGFFSSMLGGIGGALAGNWIYDQFSGRNSGHHTDASSYSPMTGSDDFSSDPAPDTWSTPEGTGGDWGDGGGGGGGDWGGGGGGDWGGGGGDWGGGGGDDGGSW